MPSLESIEKRKKYGREYSKLFRKRNPNHHKDWVKKNSINSNYRKELYKRNKLKMTGILQKKSTITKKILSPAKLRKLEYHKKWIKNNPEKMRLYRKASKAKRFNHRAISLKIIEFVYLENRRKYGVLTCIYCIKPIENDNDTLEHKIPLTRGGDNNLNNLAIACKSCNFSKRNKTEEEYRIYATHRQTKL